MIEDVSRPHDALAGLTRLDWCRDDGGADEMLSDELCTPVTN
jgi:hypothetical protein